MFECSVEHMVDIQSFQLPSSGTFYYVCDGKGRHDLIMRGWTKLGAHARSNISVFKTTTVFFSGKYGFNVLLLSLQSALYSCPRRTSRFLEAVVITRTTTTLPYNTKNHKISCHSSISPSSAMSDALRIYYTGLPCNFTAAVASGFCAIVATAYACTSPITSSNYVGGIPCMPTHN